MNLGSQIEVSAVDIGYPVRQIHIGIVVYEHRITAVFFERLGDIKTDFSRYAKLVEAPSDRAAVIAADRRFSVTHGYTNSHSRTSSK